MTCTVWFRWLWGLSLVIMIVKITTNDRNQWWWWWSMIIINDHHGLPASNHNQQHPASYPSPTRTTSARSRWGIRPEGVPPVGVGPMVPLVALGYPIIKTRITICYPILWMALQDIMEKLSMMIMIDYWWYHGWLLPTCSNNSLVISGNQYWCSGRWLFLMRNWQYWYYHGLLTVNK